MSGRAEVPHLAEAQKADDFVAINKALRACFVCRLIKTDQQVRRSRRPRRPGAPAPAPGPAIHPTAPPASAGAQFFEQGCDNCEKFLKLEGDREKVYSFTSSAFSG
jgi:hypothetical protein